MIHAFNHAGDLHVALNFLQDNGVIILPTDTSYAFACSMSNKWGIERMAQLKGIRIDKARFSIICSDLSNLATFSKPIPTPYFRILKNHTPGAFTFLLHASQLIPKVFLSRRTSIGLRVPDYPLLRDLVAKLGEPLAVTTVPMEVFSQDELIDLWEDQVGAIFLNDSFNQSQSTVVDLTENAPVVIRQGTARFEV
jgi:tRNA threonylcarbamoyl adenosine modification protein (Sua5/YciO/YrdC/YwlC family)